jgi:segregation and condensation protein B
MDRPPPAPPDAAPEKPAVAPQDGPAESDAPPADAAQAETDASPPDTDPPEIDTEALSPKLEAALLTSDRAMNAGKLAEALGLRFPGASKPVNQMIDQLNSVYDDTGRAFRIEQVAGGWQMMTRPEHADVLAALHKTKSQGKLSPAAMETLAVVAYKQPVLRADLESIRGVACGETLRSLMERHLVKIVGRAEEIGRPMLYGTTKQFLELFGLASLKDLPKVEEMRRGAGGAE